MAHEPDHEYSAENLAAFRQTFLQAIDEEQAAGRIGRLRAWTLRRVADNPRRLQRLANHVAEDCCATGHDLPGGNSAPDWTALLDFIKQLLPLLAQLIALFRV